MLIDPIKLRLALEIANPEITITEDILEQMKSWCEFQIDLVEGILNGKMCPQWNNGMLNIYQYPSDIAEGTTLLLNEV